MADRFYRSGDASKNGVDRGIPGANYTLNVVALGEMEHKEAGLSEPAGRVSGLRGMSLRATVAGY